MPKYAPIPLSAEMGPLGYWIVVWSVAPGLRLPVTCVRVGISRSEAVDDSRDSLGLVYRERESQ